MTSKLGYVALALMLCAACSSGETGVAPRFQADDMGSGLVEGKGFGEACSGNDDCRQGLVCGEEGSCAGRGNAQIESPCVLTADCGPSLFCDGTVGVCIESGSGSVGDACGGPQDCQAGLVCRSSGFGGVCGQQGGGDIGTSCEGPQDCLAGLRCVRDGAATLCQPGPPQLFAGVECTDVEGPLRMLFELPASEPSGEFYRSPYPNDARLDGAGRPQVAWHPTPGSLLLGFDLVARYLEAIERDQVGFGTNTATLLRFSAGIDLDTLRTQEGQPAPLYLVNIDAESESYNRRPGYSWFASGGRGRYICPNWLALRAGWGQPLLPNTTYAVVLTDDVEGQNGEELVQDNDFAAMLGRTDPGGEASRAWQAYAPLRAYIADQSLDGDRIIGATVFTTGDPLAPLQALRASVEEATVEGPSWTLCDEGVSSPCDDGIDDATSQRGCGAAAPDFHELHARIRLPNFQQGTAPYLEEGGDVAIVDGKAQAQGTVEVCLAMTVPKNRPMPPAGWPVLLYAHGTGGGFQSHVQVAQTLATLEEPVVMIGWDQVGHGDRLGEMRDLDPGAVVYNWSNPRAARGNFLQAASEVMSLSSWAGTLDIAQADSVTGEAIKLDAGTFAVMGHSQGGTSVPLALPFVSQAGAGVLSGAGGGLILSLLGKRLPTDVTASAQLALQERSSLQDHHPVLNLMQGYFEIIDPINTAPYLASRTLEGITSARHMFQIYGVDDQYTPDGTQKALARAMRATFVEPVVDDPGGGLAQVAVPVEGTIGELSVLGRQYESDGSYDGHFVTFRNAEAQRDLRAFLSSWLAGRPRLAE